MNQVDPKVLQALVDYMARRVRDMYDDYAEACELKLGERMEGEALGALKESRHALESVKDFLTNPRVQERCLQRN